MDRNNRAGLVLGGVFIAIGILALLGQVFDIYNWGDMWPLIIIGVGAIFFIGMILGGKQAGGLAVPGTIIITIGLILLAQSLFNLWETWSYAWALIVMAVGIGMVIYGAWSELPEIRRNGWQVVKTGLILFIVFGAIFTMIFSLTGVTTWQRAIFFPAALVVLGLYLLISRSMRLVKPAGEIASDDRDLFWPIMFIGIGLLWIFASLGWIPSSQILSLLSLWPVLLIVLGVNLLFGKRFPWVSALMGVLVVIGLFAFAIYGGSLGLTARTASWFPFTNLGEGDLFSFQRVEGSGTLVTENRPVSSFDRLSIGGVGEAVVVQGSTESLVIEAEDNILPYIISDVTGGQLEIKIKNGVTVNPKAPIRYTITVRSLNELNVSGVIIARMDALSTDQLHSDVSGSTSLTIGSLKASSLEADVSGASKFTAGGQVDSTRLDVSGAATFDGENLQVRTAVVQSSGAGTAVVWVSDHLEADASGAGTVQYYGSPQVSESTSGAGSVVSKGAK